MKPIFLFSLPRSGSTLSQRVLGSHNDISTVTEPCLLLPYLYSLRDKGVYSEYGHEVTAWGIQDFCRQLPNGHADYLSEIRELVLRLYAKASAPSQRYFLDKAPNYSFIAQEIIELFPEGKFIFLWRNPLSVVSSLVGTWHGGRWSLYQFDVHLYKGLERLTEAYQKYAERAVSLRFEDMLRDPIAEWQRIFNYLEVEFNPHLLSNIRHLRLNGRLGDPTAAAHYEGFSQEPLGKWKEILANPIRKSWCRRYIQWIGRDRLALMGYDLARLGGELDDLKASWRFFGSDLFWFPYSLLYRTFEGRIMRDKILALRARQHVHMHK